MLIIIEGVDETGKTTLAKKLGGEYRHSGPPGDSGPLYEYTRQLLGTQEGIQVVIDRFHWGEAIYGPEYRGESGLDPEMLYWLDLVVGGKGGVVVLCVDEPNAISHSVDLNDDDFVRHDRAHLRSLQAHFVELTGRTTLPVSVHSITRPVDISTVTWTATTRADNLLGARVITGGHLLSATTIPTILLVGDEPGSSGDEISSGFPFYPRPNSSGHFLMGALQLTSLHRDVMIVNSMNRGLTDINALIEVVPSLSSVVALGNGASDRLTDQDVPHTKVFHPQFARRFHHHEKSQYAAGLFAAAKLGFDMKIGGWLH